MPIKMCSLFLVLMLLCGCCAHDNQQTADSPDGKYRAYACSLDCSAIAPFEPAVWLFKKNMLFFKNPYLDVNKTIFRCEGSGRIAVRWENNRTLIVSTMCDLGLSNPTISWQITKYEDVAIKYEFQRQEYRADTKRGQFQ